MSHLFTATVMPPEPSWDDLVEAQNDAAEAMFAATRALFERAKLSRTYVTVFSSKNLHMPINGLVTEAEAYWAKLTNFKFHYDDVSDISYDGETDSLHITV